MCQILPLSCFKSCVLCVCVVMTESAVCLRFPPSRDLIWKWFLKNSWFIFGSAILFLTDRLLFLRQYIWYRWVANDTEKQYGHQIQTVLPYLWFKLSELNGNTGADTQLSPVYETDVSNIWHTLTGCLSRPWVVFVPVVITKNPWW